jgi:hypothetical protein
VPLTRNALAALWRRSGGPVSDHRCVNHGATSIVHSVPQRRACPGVLDDFRGRPTLLLFWNPSCGFCQRLLNDLTTWETHRPTGAPDCLCRQGEGGKAGDDDVKGSASMGHCGPNLLQVPVEDLTPGPEGDHPTAGGGVVLTRAPVSVPSQFRHSRSPRRYCGDALTCMDDTRAASMNTWNRNWKLCWG